MLVFVFGFGRSRRAVMRGPGGRIMIHTLHVVHEVDVGLDIFASGSYGLVGVRLSLVSSALYTTPIPPAPSFSKIL